VVATANAAPHFKRSAINSKNQYPAGVTLPMNTLRRHTMTKGGKRVPALTFLAIGLFSVGAITGCTDQAAKQEADNKQQVVVSTEKEGGGETRVTCTLPQLTFNKVFFAVQTVTVRDASGTALPANHKYRQPVVSFVAPDNKLEGITLDAVYVDARAIKETTTDPDKRADWQVRPHQFKLSELLKNGEFKDE